MQYDPVRFGKKGSLADSEQLLALTRERRQVKALFFGHTHIWYVAQDRSGIHLVNLPATGYTLWMRSFLGWVDCQLAGEGATLTIHALSARQRENGEVVRLKWRAA